MATFQCTCQWTRRFLRGRQGATLCRHNQVVSASRAIPATKMKTGSDHVVPLSRQALTILRSVHKLTGDRRYGPIGDASTTLTVARATGPEQCLPVHEIGPAAQHLVVLQLRNSGAVRCPGQ